MTNTQKAAITGQDAGAITRSVKRHLADKGIKRPARTVGLRDGWLTVVHMGMDAGDAEKAMVAAALADYQGERAAKVEISDYDVYLSQDR